MEESTDIYLLALYLIKQNNKKFHRKKVEVSHDYIEKSCNILTCSKASENFLSKLKN